MKKYIIVLVIICFGFTQKNNAQVINYEGETIFVHINATTFVTGENLLYKIYCLNNNSKQISEISKIAYIEIIDDNNNVILRNKIALNKGVASNEFFINTNFNTGNYKLIAYTNWMLNNVNSKYFEADISIINPFLPTNNKQISSNEIDPSVTIKTSNSDKKNNDISLNFRKKIFSKREKLELDITSNSEKFIGGNFSISVRKIDALIFNQATNSIDFINNNNTDKFINLGNISFLPELRGELLSGKITTNDSEKSVKDKHIALSITGSPFDLKIVKTNNNGEFNFILDKDLMKKEGRY